MNDIAIGCIVMGLGVAGLFCLRWQERARKRIEEAAQTSDNQLWVRTERDLKLIRNAFVVLLLFFYGLAYYWRMYDSSRQEAYVFMAMVFGLIGGRAAWEGWIYAKLMRPQSDELRRLAKKMALVTGLFNLSLVGFISIAFTQMLRG